MFGPSLFWKTFNSYALVLLLSAIGLALIYGQHIEDNARQKIDRILKFESMILAEQIKLGMHTNLSEKELLNFSPKNRTFTHDFISDIRVKKQTPLTTTGNYFTSDENGNRIFTLLIPDSEFQIQSLASNKIIDKHLRALRLKLFAQSFLAFSMAIFLNFVIAKGISRPSVKMQKQAKLIAAGDYQQRIPLSHQKELDSLISSFNTISDKAEKRIEEITTDKNKLSTILSGMIEGVIAVDNRLRIIHLNETAARFFQVSSAESMGKLIWEVITLPEFTDLIEKVVRDGNEARKKFDITSYNSNSVLDVYGAALAGEEGNDGAVIVFHDSTELNRLETVRKDFIVNASHELKTPITAIRSILETILDDDDMPVEIQKSFLQKSQIQTERMVAIVSDLMALSRLESGDSDDFQQVSITDILHESYSSYLNIGAQNGVKLSSSFYPENKNITLFGDAHALRQMIDNLLDNAIKYSAMNQADIQTQGQVDISQNIEDSMVIITISDSGRGIKSEDQLRIFERFYRVDKGRSRELGGTGLGLSIVKHIIEQHRGSILLDSEFGKGSSFTIKLPIT